jgi:hypothetical protein
MSDDMVALARAMGGAFNGEVCFFSSLYQNRHRGMSAAPSSYLPGSERMAPKSKIPERITRAWVRDNPELFKELSTPPEECPLCLKKIRRPTSPLLGDYPTSCRHFCCRQCWETLFLQGPREWKCPLCRESLHKWLGDLFGAPVRIERFDKEDIKLFVKSAMVRLLNDNCTPMSAEVRESFRTLAAEILRDAESSDEDIP